MTGRPPTLGASLWRNVLLPRGLALAGWWALNQWVKLPLWGVWGLILADVLLFIWFTRLHILAADDHQRGSGAMGPVWGGYLLVMLGAMGSVTLWWDAGLIAQRPEPDLSYAETRIQEREASYSLRQVGTVLELEGEITFGLIQKLQMALEQDPAITDLQLTSPGGHIYEARGAAQLVHRHGLRTRAKGICASACTLIFAAGRDRELMVDAQLGFHGYSLQVFGGLPQVSPAREQEKDRRYLQQRGIAAGFLQRAFATPADDMWFPSRQTLLDAGVIHR